MKSLLSELMQYDIHPEELDEIRATGAAVEVAEEV